MPSRFYRSDGLKVYEVFREAPTEVHSVHQDTFKTPLIHPETGELVDSMTRWEQINKAHNLSCVGNERLSDRPVRRTETITEEKVMDAIHKAEAIASDPSKMRAWRYNQHERIERIEKLVYAGRR